LLYSWSHRGRINLAPTGTTHKAFKLKEVKAVLADYQENHLEGPNAFPKWDKAKWLMRTSGRDGWENIINVQMIIDFINAKNEEGAVAFLD
jgi:hypothetical protein